MSEQWEACHGFNDWSVQRVGGAMVAALIPDEEAARLIAAAPAMYDLLQRIANDIHDDVPDIGVWERDILQVLKAVTS